MITNRNSRGEISDKDKIAILIQEDTEAQFGCRVSVCDIENI